MDSVTKDTLINLVRNKFKETGKKPIKGILRDDRHGCCALGVLVGEDKVPYGDGLVAEMLNRMYNLTLVGTDVKEMILGWDDHKGEPAFHELYRELRYGSSN